MRTIVDGVITIDSDGFIVDFNPACETLFGYKAAEIVGCNVKQLMPDPYRGEHDSYLANYRTTGQRKIIGIGREVIGQRKDGTTFPMELSVGEIEHGTKRAFVGVIRDLTARARLEQGLRDSEAQHRAVIDTAVDGIIIIDQLGTVRIYNPACEKMFLYGADEVIGRNVKMLMPSPYFDEHDVYLRNYQETRQRKIIGIGREVIGRRKNGTTFPMELSVGEAMIGGLPMYVGVLRDITRAKAAEEGLRQKESMLQERVAELEVARDRLEQHKTEMAELARQASIARQAADTANQAKSEFLAIVSHELRTPMNAILGFARMLDDACLSTPHAERASMILKAGDALMTILNDILDLSKIEAGRLGLIEEAILLDDKLKHIEELWRAAAEQKGLYLHTSAQPGLPQAVMGDPVRLRQVLFNLVNNAVKFTSHGGITVSVSSEGRRDNVHLLRFEVADTGIGVPEDKQEVIFEAFTQANSTASRRYGGTGLGLNISKRLVELMGGAISVTSRPGEGATFSFTVPCREASVSDAERVNRDEAALGLTPGLRVLLAEDHAINQKMLRTILESVGYHVDVVDNGLEALSAVRTSPYDVILMDVSMPEMDGLEATHHIRGLQGPEGRIPIIALTANAMAGDRERFLQAGMTDYLSKPIKVENLLAALEHQHRIAQSPKH